MKRAVLLALALLLTPPTIEARLKSDAAWVMRVGRDVQVRLLKAPCANEKFTPEVRELLQEGVFIDRKGVIRFCYSVIEDDDITLVVLVKEDGDAVLINASRFTQEIVV